MSGKNNKLNMLIAKTHRLSTRVLGLQLTGGNFIGIALSAIQMSAGFLILSKTLIAGQWYLGILIGIVGIALAILIERLSLGGLSAIRVMQERRQRIDDEFYAMLKREKRVAEEAETEERDARKKEVNNQIRVATVFAVLGMVLSAVLGDVFWHEIFAPLKEWYIVYPMSLACAAVIGLTFVHSELYKAIMDGVLREILADMHLMKVAVAVEEQNMQLDMMVDAYDKVRANDEVRKPAEDKIERVLTKRLSSFADQVNQASNEVAALNMVPSVNVVEGSMSYPALPAPKGKYGQHKSELIRLLKNNPQLSQRDIANHFGVSRSTANDWFKKLKSGQ